MCILYIKILRILLLDLWLSYRVLVSIQRRGRRRHMLFDTESRLVWMHQYCRRWNICLHREYWWCLLARGRRWHLRSDARGNYHHQQCARQDSLPLRRALVQSKRLLSRVLYMDGSYDGSHPRREEEWRWYDRHPVDIDTPSHIKDKGEEKVNPDYEDYFCITVTCTGVCDCTADDDYSVYYA